MMTVNHDPLLSMTESAQYLGLSKKTLDKWKREGKYPELSPTFLGTRVFFRKSVLNDFIEARTRKALNGVQL
jgi:excisionase family DNA binding protein